MQNGERAPRDVGASRWATSSCDGSFSSGSGRSSSESPVCISHASGRRRTGHSVPECLGRPWHTRFVQAKSKCRGQWGT
eukprot:g40238.t1